MMDTGRFRFTVIFLAVVFLWVKPVYSQVPMYKNWLQDSHQAEVNSSEIRAYVNSAIAIQEILQSTQQAMWQSATDNDMDLRVVYKLKKEIENNPEAIIRKIPRDIIKSYRQIIWQAEEYEDEMRELIIRAIESTGLSVDRFNYIRKQLSEEPSIAVQTLQEFQDIVSKASETPGKEIRHYIQPVLNNIATRNVTADYPAYVYHLTITGNTLWDLSEYYYGNPDLWPVIYNYNSDKVLLPRRLRIGELLRIPAQYMVQPPEPVLTVDDKYEIISGIFPFDTFRRNSFAYIAQEQELHSRIQIYSTLSDIQSQIEENQHLRGELYKAPDFLSLLIPVDQLEGQQDQTDEPDVALDNMVIDETRSPFGGEYFERFRSKLELPEAQHGLFVRVIERPVPGRGSQIAIQVNQEVIYQFQLQPGYDQIKNIADASANGLSKYLNDYDTDFQNIY